MAKKKDSNLVQDALIPDEMSPLSLLDFNSSCAKIKQAAVDFRRAVNHKMQLETNRHTHAALGLLVVAHKSIIACREGGAPCL